MTAVVLCSAKGSPGVTTLACALATAWPPDRRVVVVESDPGGGDLASWFGLSTRRGIAGCVVAVRRAGLARRWDVDLAHLEGPLERRSSGAVARESTRDGTRESASDDERPEGSPRAPVEGAEWLEANVQRLPGGVEVLVGPSGAEAASAVGRQLGDVMAELVAAFDRQGVDVLVDCGRLLVGDEGQRQVLAAADAVVVLCRSDVPGVAATRWLVPRLEGPSLCLLATGGATVGVLGSGDGVVAAAHAAEVLGLDLGVEVAHDPRTAAALRGEATRRRRGRRSPLLRSVGPLVTRLASGAPPPSDDEGLSVAPSSPTRRALDALAHRAAAW